ncbi:hypothetical protein [Pedobacter agri]|uniref:hypothetical protein n=1 Tax=Pedobacter agri TaxID=454586 RepID=UPI002930427C|nr:hypothetical protein [Pedobacter agri]
MLKRYLIIGLIISITSMSEGCIKDDFYDQYGQYQFINETNYNITYNTGLESFNLLPKSTTTFEEKSRGAGKKAEESNYSSPFRHYSGDLVIKFNNQRCLVNIKEEDVHSIRNIKNYTAERVNDVTYKFTYTFTEADYNLAVNCP